MTEDRETLIAEARKLIEGITPGEWRTDGPDQFPESKVTVTVYVDEDDVISPGGEPKQWVVCFTPYDSYRHREDMRFIAAAPRLIRQLLALVDSREQQRPNRHGFGCTHDDAREQQDKA
jgi:hypothetical protein